MSKSKQLTFLMTKLGSAEADAVRRPRLIFFGNERLATGVVTKTPTLQALINEGYEIAAVVSNYTRGVSRNARDLEIAKVAEVNNIPLLLPKNPPDIASELKN